MAAQKTLKNPHKKPYPKNTKTPSNTEEILEERLREALEKAKRVAVRKKYSKILLAFADETAIQDKPNFKGTLWGTIQPMEYGGRKKFCAIGVYVLDGKSAVILTPSCKADSFVRFLKALRRNNLDSVLVLVVDNARIHKARVTLHVAERNDIILAYLSPHSPHLNPIDFVWQDCKRGLSVFAFEDRVNKFLSVFMERVSGGGYVSYLSGLIGGIIDDSRFLPSQHVFSSPCMSSVRA